MTISIVFPGQGSQFPGMGKNLFYQHQTARTIFEEASDSLQLNLKEYCFGKHTDQLMQTKYTQLAVFVVSYATFRILQENLDLHPRILLGHSLGELTALVSANTFSFTDGLEIVRTRGELMQEASIGDYKMAAIIGLDSSDVQAYCENISRKDNIVEISNYNSRDQTVISGHEDAVKQVVRQIQKTGGKVIYLNVTSPFHSSIMSEPATLFGEYIKRFRIKKPEIDVLSNVTGDIHEDILIHEMLSRQIVQPVDWVACMNFLHQQNITDIIEVGPGTSLSNILKNHLPNAQVYSIGELTELEQIKRQLTQIYPHYRFLKKCISIAVSTQNKGLQNSESQKMIVHHYKELVEMYEKLRKDVILNGEMQQILFHFTEILRLKFISNEDWQERHKQLAIIAENDRFLVNILINLNEEIMNSIYSKN
ncbi:ACP S-malonyltransferase [Lysinibacillus xylanilyticus]|uniref:ACP S-malonyltransferase n=1 Tax=Lysinibacillus xylanilyticus TaxID=582475 RepID=UPI002B24E8AA|nr:ACP S-malonyltransferase [Lysinibacillus xylanilyticus]MEB2281717.1 ACP S-malonyltransferase [Lysinibacillus xylanilyticus]